MSSPQRRRTDRALFRALAGPAALGLRDDVALLRTPPGRDLVLTDRRAGRRRAFLRRRSARRDRAQGAAGSISPTSPPRAPRRSAFSSTSRCRADWTEAWLEAFAAGARRGRGAPTGARSLGGDTVKTPGPLTLSITAFGAVPAGRMAARTGAGPGDRLYVTGTIGDAALGLRLRLGRGPDTRRSRPALLVERYLLPQPRLALAPAMARYADGGMDVSDGFVGDLTKMLRVSGVTARSSSPAAAVARRARGGRRRSRAVRDCATGGDDYEILAACRPRRRRLRGGRRRGGRADRLRRRSGDGAGPPRSSAGTARRCVRRRLLQPF